MRVRDVQTRLRDLWSLFDLSSDQICQRSTFLHIKHLGHEVILCYHNTVCLRRICSGLPVCNRNIDKSIILAVVRFGPPAIGIQYRSAVGRRATASYQTLSLIDTIYFYWTYPTFGNIDAVLCRLLYAWFWPLRLQPIYGIYCLCFMFLSSNFYPISVTSEAAISLCRIKLFRALS